MSEAAIKAAIWPQCPDRFDERGIALLMLMLPENTARAEARNHVREVLLQFANRLSLRCELVETPTGPKFADPRLSISISYAPCRALIGIAAGSKLGVDIVKIERIEEAAALCRLYMPKAATAQGAEISDEAFAQKWAELEACCKAQELPLTEIDAQRETAYAACDLLECEQPAGYRIALAVN